MAADWIKKATEEIGKEVCRQLAEHGISAHLEWEGRFEKIIARVVPQGSAPEWIRVKDRMPKVGIRVFVSIVGAGFKRRTIGIWTSKEWCRAGFEKPVGAECRPVEGEITHWMHLPKVPKGYELAARDVPQSKPEEKV